MYRIVITLTLLPCLAAANYHGHRIPSDQQRGSFQGIRCAPFRFVSRASLGWCFRRLKMHRPVR